MAYTNIVTIYKSNFQQSLIPKTTLIMHISIMLYVKSSCPEPTCNSTYIGETAHRLDKRIKEQVARNNSGIFRHSVDTAVVDSDNFKIVATGSKHAYTRKIAEAFYIKK